EIGVEQRDMLDVVARNQFSEVVHNSFHAVGVKAPLVKHLIRTVIALVWTAYATCVRQLANTRRSRVEARVRHVIRWPWQTVDVHDRPLWLLNDASFGVLK